MQGRGVDRVIRPIAPHAVGLGVSLNQRNPGLIAAGVLQIADGFGIDWEEAAGRAIFGSHVGDGRAVGERQIVQTLAVEFDELVHHAVLAQHLHDLQHQIGGRGAFHHRAGQFEADNFGDQHGDGLAQHGGLSLDPADAPAQDRHAVDHGGVAVGADERVGIGDLMAVLVGVGPNGLGEIFQVHLVADAGAGRHNAEVVKRVLAPFQEDITLHVPLIFAVDVGLERAGGAEFVDHHRVVDDQINRCQRVDGLGLAAQPLDAVAHRRQIDHGRNAGEVLHQHAGGAVGDLDRVLAAHLSPVGEGFDVVD